MSRLVTLPERRSFELSGWASVDPTAPDDALDRLAGDTRRGRGADAQLEPLRGRPGEPRVVRLRRRPRHVVGGRPPAEAHPWIEWRTPQTVRLGRIRLLPGGPEHATPSRVRLSAASGSRDAAVVEGTAVTLPVGRDGVVEPPPSCSAGARFRLTVVATRPAREPQRRLRSVAIGEIEGAGVAAGGTSGRASRGRARHRGRASTAAAARSRWRAFPRG